MNISNDVSEHTNYEIKSKCMLLRFDEIVTSLVPVSSGKSDYTLSFMDTEKTMDEFCICIYSRSCNHQNIISIHQNLYQSCHQSTNITSVWKKNGLCPIYWFEPIFSRMAVYKWILVQSLYQTINK